MTSSKSPKEPSESESESAFRQRLSICITLPLISMALLAGVMAWQVRRQHAATDRIQEFNGIIASARHLNKLSIDLETGARAYLITGARAFLEPYSRARPAVEGTLTRLQASVAGVPSEAQKAEKLKGSLGAWLDGARKAIELRSRTAPHGAFTVNAVPAAPGTAATIAEERRRMGPVHALLSSIIRSEENARAQEEQDEALRGRLALGMGIGLAFGLGILMSLVFGAQIRATWQTLQDELRRARGATSEREATIRELHQDLEKARSEAGFFRHIVQEANGYSLIKVAPDGSIQSWNHGAERLHGFGRGEALGRDFSILFGPKAVEAGKPARMLEIAARKARYSEEGWRARKDGSLFWGELVVNPVHDDFGELDGFSVLVSDLTARKRADNEQAILFSRVEEAIRARDQFLSIASHEIKIPTIALSRQIQGLLLQQPAGSSTLKPLLEGFRRQTDRLQRMADEMVDLARSHAGRLAYDLRRTQLDDLLRGLIERLGDQAAASGCPIELEGTTAVVGNWDPLRIEQALAHLLSNAIRFGQGKPITVTVSTEPGRAVVSIRDRGPGIGEERKDRIFERFSSERFSSERFSSERFSSRGSAATATATADSEAGLGLGLYLSRKIAEGHGGQLRLESSPSGGATFHLELPILQAAGTEASPTEATGLTTAGISKGTATKAPRRAKSNEATT